MSSKDRREPDGLLIKVNSALSIMEYTVQLPLYLTQLSLVLTAGVNICLYAPTNGGEQYPKFVIFGKSFGEFHLKT